MSALEEASTTANGYFGAKRVILRLRVDDFDKSGYKWEDHVDAIDAYWRWLEHELETDATNSDYFAHVEPFQAPELQQKTFHVILDIQYSALRFETFDDIPHEVYRVRRKDDGHL